MNIKDNVRQLIGKTPLVRVDRFRTQQEVDVDLLVKVEAFNPGGSVKDRIALSMLEEAKQRGQLTEHSVIVEPTSGNTGIGLAMIGASLGLRVVLTMPESMSLERRKLLAAYGAELILTPAAKGMQGAVDMAEELVAKTPNAFMPSQFSNPDNALAHYRTTGPEIWADTEGTVDVLVSAIGTGGTISGIGRFLKEKNPAIRVIGVEPEASPLLTQGHAGPHKIQGIGANFVPDVFDRRVVDEILTVANDEAFAMARALGRSDGLLVGISSGAALAAAISLAKRPEYQGKRMVVILPDTGERYLSTELFTPTTTD